MANVPAELRYTKEHEWARHDGDLIVIGITDHAQDALGDVVYVEFAEVGERLAAHKPFVVESVKAASDLFAPLSGEVVEVNSALFDNPEVINSDPYGEGWLIKLRPSDSGEWESLLSASDYEALLS
jgi:glycine cleavage system H protein